MKRIIITLGTGRCGTRSFAELLRMQRDTVSSHEKHARECTRRRRSSYEDLKYIASWISRYDTVTPEGGAICDSSYSWLFSEEAIKVLARHLQWRPGGTGHGNPESEILAQAGVTGGRFRLELVWLEREIAGYVKSRARRHHEGDRFVAHGDNGETHEPVYSTFSGLPVEAELAHHWWMCAMKWRRIAKAVPGDTGVSQVFTSDLSNRKYMEPLLGALGFKHPEFADVHVKDPTLVKGH